jgi:phage antirepressor YoqD-like protein
MNSIISIGSAAKTMSSREIAELVDSRHDSVKRTIDRCAESGVIVQPPLVDGAKAANGITEKLYLLDKRSSLIVVAQLCPEFTARIVDRWQELEGQVAAPAKVELSTLQILDLARESELGRLAALEQVQQQQAQLAIAAPKVAFVDRYVVATGLKGFREVCKLLGANESRFREFLTDNKIMYRLGGSMTAHAQHLDAGRFEVRAGASEVSGHAFNACKFTSKGVEWIAGEWAKHQIRAEVAA